MNLVAGSPVGAYGGEDVASGPAGGRCAGEAAADALEYRLPVPPNLSARGELRWLLFSYYGPMDVAWHNAYDDAYERAREGR